MNIKPVTKKMQPLRAKLIFNPGSGTNDESAVQFLEVIREMQRWDIIPEVYMIQPDCDLTGIIRNAAAQGIRMCVVCGGDGTIATVAKALIGTDVVLGIIPMGTQNNIALSLDIPVDVSAAVAILRKGKRTMIDAGTAQCRNGSSFFMEMCSVGLFSTLYSAGDDVQHGDVARIGDFLTILAKTPPSTINLTLDDHQEVRESGHVVLITNMPYMGQHYRVGDPDAFRDGLLDVLFFADLSTLDLISYVLRGPGRSEWEDPRIKHFRVRKVVVQTEPAMPVMIDGTTIGEGSVIVEVRSKSIAVMLGKIVERPAESTTATPAQNIKISKLGFTGFLGTILHFTSRVPTLFRVLSSLLLFGLLLLFTPLAIRTDFWSAVESHIALVISLLILCVVAISLAWAPGQRLDVRFLLFFNLHRRRSDFLDWTMLILTQIGSGPFAFLFGLILLLTSSRTAFFTFLLGSLSLLLMVEFLKLLFNRSRPYVLLNSVRIVGSQDSGRSFPSGHTSQAFFMATFMTVNFDLNIFAIAAFFGTALLVGVTRMYVGMHYPRDVFGGAMLGISWGLLGLIVTQFIFQIA